MRLQHVTHAAVYVLGAVLLAQVLTVALPVWSVSTPGYRRAAVRAWKTLVFVFASRVALTLVIINPLAWICLRAPQWRRLFYPYSPPLADSSLDSGSDGHKDSKTSFDKVLTSLDRRLENEIRLADRERIREDFLEFMTSTGRWRRFDLTPADKEHVIAQLFDDLKWEIAAQHRQIDLLYFDLQSDLSVEFSILARHLGADVLRNLILKAPQLGKNAAWMGPSRRIERATKDLRAQPDPNSRYSRRYDRPEVLRQVASGIAYA